jgi:hypothetical protein
MGPGLRQDDGGVLVILDRAAARGDPESNLKTF